MDSGKILQFLKLKSTTKSSLLDSSLCKLVPPNEIQLVTPPNKRRPFRFQRIFTPDDSLQQLSQQVSLPLVRHVLQGSNASAIVVGPPGSGKTTALFSDSGLVEASVGHLFSKISHLKETCSFVVMVSLVQVSQGRVRDLGLAYSKSFQLQPQEIKRAFELQDLEVKDSNSKSYVQNVELIQVSQASDVFLVIQKGFKLMHAGAHCVLSLSVSQKPFNSKTTKSSRLLFADVSGSDFSRLQEHSDLSSLRLVLNKANLVYHNVPFVTVPFRSSKLTHILQSAFAGVSQVHLLSMIDIGSESYEEAYAALRYSKSLLQIDKMLKRKITSTPDASEAFDHIARLQQEIEDLRGNFKKVQSYHDERLKYLARLVGVDEDLEALLVAQKGSHAEQTAKKYREAKLTVSTLRQRGRQLKEKLFTNKNILEEIKLVNRNNQQKNEREITELQHQIKATRDQLDDIRERQEEAALEHALASTENLQKLLLHSHLVLEEKSALIHNLYSQMKVRASKVKGLSETWEQGKTETLERIKKQLHRKEAEYREAMANLEAQYEYILQARDSSIRTTSYSVTEKQAKWAQKLSQTKREGVRLLAVAQQQASVIKEVREGVYNNSIVPVIIPLKDVHTLTDLDRFALLGQAAKSGRNVQISSPKRHTVRLSKPLSRSIINEAKFDASFRQTPTSDIATLQESIKDMVSQIQTLRSQDCGLSEAKAALESALSEKALWEKQYQEMVRQRLGGQTRHSAGRLTQKEVLPKAHCDYTDLKNNRIPIVPKAQRRLIGTARPGDRMIPNTRMSHDLLRKVTPLYP